LLEGYLQTKQAVDRTSGLYHWCRTEALSGELPWNCTGEQLCGRPLGLRLHEAKGHFLLYILDAYHGMFQINTSSLAITHLFDAATPHSVAGRLLRADDTHRPRFFNDFDLQTCPSSPLAASSLSAEGLGNDDNSVPALLFFLTDSSSRHHRCQNRQAIIDGAPTGRLFLFNTSAEHKHLSLLISSLHFPNGVQFLSQASPLSVPSLLLIESSRFRILRVRTTDLLTHLLSIGNGDTDAITSLPSLLESPSSGVTVYLSSVPGFMDNIRSIPLSPFLPPELPTATPLYTLSLGTLSCQPFSLLHLLYQSYWLRIIIGRVLPMRYLEHAVPAYGYIAILSETTGGVVTSFQDPTGRTPFLSQGNFHPLTGDLWLGSHSNKYLAIKRWKAQATERQ
jgi:hypothetical protein